jgi:hypothetical protein
VSAAQKNRARPRIGVAPNWPHTLRDLALIAFIIVIASLGGVA